MGAVLPAALSFAILKRFMDARLVYSDYEIIISMFMHGMIWGLAGAWAGVAFAVGLGRPRLVVRAAAVGFAGAVLGAIAFELVGAGLFPLASTGEPISTTWPSRLAAAASGLRRDRLGRHPDPAGVTPRGDRETLRSPVGRQTEHLVA